MLVCFVLPGGRNAGGWPCACPRRQEQACLAGRVFGAQSPGSRCKRLRLPETGGGGQRECVKKQRQRQHESVRGRGSQQVNTAVDAHLMCRNDGRLLKACGGQLAAKGAWGSTGLYGAAASDSRECHETSFCRPPRASRRSQIGHMNN